MRTRSPSTDHLPDRPTLLRLLAGQLEAVAGQWARLTPARRDELARALADAAESVAPVIAAAFRDLAHLEEARR